MVVLSESMEPAFSRGDIILLANWQEVEVGDIPVIWFQGHPLPMVHRAVEVLFADDQERLIMTKGDNNEVNDVVLYPFGQTHTISAACWIWNNPRHLTFRLNTTATWSSRALFIIRRALKVSLLLVANSFVNKAHIYLKADLLDFTPDKYPIIRPIISQIVFDCSRDDCTYSPVSQRQIFLRIFTVFSWIWSNFLILESYHAILSTTFVLLGIDNPKDWPPLFGSITDAWTVQRFWGRFWHRIATPTLTTWTRTILRITHEPQTTFDKATVAFGVFFLSGIMHMTAAWRTGEGYLHLDVEFFCANFFAIAVEIVVSRAWMQVVRWAKLTPGAEARGPKQSNPWSDWIWSEDHGRYYCYRTRSNGEIEYEWDEGEPTEERAIEPAIEQNSPGDRTPTPARSGPIVRSEITYTDNEGNVIKIVHRYPPDDVVKDEFPVDGDDWAIVPVKARNTDVGDDFVDSFWGDVAEV
ncbi:Acetyltransferase TRI7 [Colletotrichum sp. SAR 10_86]|nr:Acetyltransferase TRI7 [Colletotrichum sp. SAR 10_71]KAI8206595.1 Acetyltransferase TRI7 [Colletotrichum sp. SAR 10_65]KAI8214896.1 Acetyltransferase TRI7 [Colletotrichum sp. SAR 10_76]KAI8238145.1 Acetyltransferase TRI7 [Colletotrichum sp. SAR 10_86]